MGGIINHQGIVEAEVRLRLEHQEIGTIAGGLRQVRDADALVIKLMELHEFLRRHFAHEEYPGGLYDQIGACSGSHRDQVHELVDEHYNLLSVVLSLTNEVRDGGPDAVTDVLGEIDDVLANVRDHESREHRLVAELKSEG